LALARSAIADRVNQERPRPEHGAATVVPAHKAVGRG